jgi:hypothetical protein
MAAHCGLIWKIVVIKMEDTFGGLLIEDKSAKKLELEI